jgi:hypothetical protein
MSSVTRGTTLLFEHPYGLLFGLQTQTFLIVVTQQALHLINHCAVITPVVPDSLTLSVSCCAGFVADMKPM